MDDEDHMVYSDEFEPSTLDHARRKLLNDFEKVRNPGCTKWQAKRKYAAERYLAHVDELLKDQHGEFTFYSVAYAACVICRLERDQFCEPNDVWFWAERRQWPDITGSPRPLPVFLSGDLALDCAQRWVGRQPVTVFYGSNRAKMQAARWVVQKMHAADGTSVAFDPPHFIDMDNCSAACFRGFCVASDR